MFRRKYSAGFTLIELLVVVAIMGVISITGIAAFVAYDRSQKLNNATLDVVSMLNSAKARAQSQVKPDFCVTNDIALNAYKITLSTSTYTMNVICINSVGTEFESPTILTKTLPSGHTFSGALSDIRFPVLKGGVVGDGTITIDNGEGDTQDIEIDTGGNIKIE